MVSEAEAALALHGAKCLPVLNFAIIDDLDISLTPAIATVLHEILPQSYICTFSGRSDEVTNRLASREADIAISATVPKDIGQFQIRELFSEQFALVVAKGCYRQNEDWQAQLTSMPFIQYSDSMPMGQLVLTHLKRMKFDVPRRLSFETSRSVIATVANTGGWTLATPLNILDASRFHDKIEIFSLPFTELSRSVFIINRVYELSSIADTLFQTLHYLLQRDVLTELDKITPELSKRLIVHSPESTCSTTS
jgi:DNA-binding transcriptional LysR family regulator